MTPIESRIRRALATEAAMWPDPALLGATSQPNRGRRRWVAIAVALVAVVSIAATFLLTRDVTEPTAVACFREARLDSDIAAADLGGDLDASLCASVWADGPLVNEDIVAIGEVPPLVACVSDVGSLWVFPTDDETICEELGLATPDPHSIPQGNDIRRLTEDLVNHFDQQDCQPLSAAATDVREILDDRGFGAWQIRVGNPRSDRPCASLAVDPEQQTIHLVPIPEL